MKKKKVSKSKNKRFKDFLVYLIVFLVLVVFVVAPVLNLNFSSLSSSILGTEFSENPQLDYDVGSAHVRLSHHCSAGSGNAVLDIGFSHLTFEPRSLQSTENSFKLVNRNVDEKYSLYHTDYTGGAYDCWVRDNGGNNSWKGRVCLFVNGEKKGCPFSIRSYEINGGTRGGVEFWRNGFWSDNNVSEGYSDVQLVFEESGLNLFNQGIILGSYPMLTSTVYKEPELCNVADGLGRSVFSTTFPAGTVLSLSGESLLVNGSEYYVPVRSFCHDTAMLIRKIDSNSDVTLSTSFEEYDMLNEGSSVTIPEGQVWNLSWIIFNEDLPNGIVCDDGFEFNEDFNACIPSFITACSSGQFNPVLGYCVNGSWQPCLSGFYNIDTGECFSVTGECEVIDGYETPTPEIKDGVLVCTYVPSDVPDVSGTVYDGNFSIIIPTEQGVSFTSFGIFLVIVVSGVVLLYFMVVRKK